MELTRFLIKEKGRDIIVAVVYAERFEKYEGVDAFWIGKTGVTVIMTSPDYDIVDSGGRSRVDDAKFTP